MADNHLEGQGSKKSENGANEAHRKLLDDTSFSKYVLSDSKNNSNSDQLSGITSSSFGRSVYALTEGVSLTPYGIFNAVQHEYNHPDELIGKAVGGAAFGVGLRLLLPKEGAARALVGTCMTYFLVRDVAKP